MVRIRLRRTGAKKQPSYRVVVAPQKAARDGRFLEIIGHYNPRTEPPTVVIKEDRARYWLSQGAQPSKPVAWMLYKQGIIDDVTRYKVKIYDEVAQAEAPAIPESPEPPADAATEENAPVEEPVEEAEEAA